MDEVAGYSCSCPQYLTGQDCETCQIENCQSCDLSSSPARCAQCENGYTLNTAGACNISGGLGQECQPITQNDILRVLRSYLEEGQTCPGSSICQASLSVEETYINCVAPGRTRGTQSHVTVTLRYARSDRIGLFISQLDIGCSNITDQWEAVVLRSLASSLSQVFSASSGTLDNNTATSCAACLSPSLAMQLSLTSQDQAHHCVGE